MTRSIVSLLNFCLRARRSLLALILVWVLVLTMWSLLYSPCLWVLLFPPTVQRHAGEMKWKVYIACRCENECVTYVLALWWSGNLSGVYRVLSHRCTAGIITSSNWPWRRYRKWDHGWEVWLKLQEEKITRKRQNTDHTIEKHLKCSAKICHSNDLLILKSS